MWGRVGGAFEGERECCLPPIMVDEIGTEGERVRERKSEVYRLATLYIHFNSHALQT